MTLNGAARLMAGVATIVAVATSAGSAHARDMVGYEIVGQARASDSNARTRALDKAFAKAVKRALRDVLSPAMRRKHAAALRDKVVRHARKLVVSYRVHKQKVTEGTLQIKVGVLVDRDKVRATLRELGINSARASATQSTNKRPKIMVLLHATVVGKTHVTYGDAPGGRDGGAAGKAFIAALKHRGFDVVITKTPPPVSQNADPGLPMDDAAATSLAKSNGAGGVVIVGIQVQAGGVIRGTKLKGATARATVRLLDVAKNQVVARATMSDAGFGTDATKAAASAAANIGSNAVAKVGEVAQRYWPTTTAITDGVAIMVRGDIEWKAIAGLLSSLRAATEITSAAARRFRPGEVALVVRGAIANLAKPAALKRAAAIINAAIIGTYAIKTTLVGTDLTVTITATKATP